MSPSLYTHTFTWPPTPSQSVVVTGTFDNWSGDRHHLHKNEAKGGYWEGTVEIPFGEKVAYKYVVDGNWLIREDEAKEWDAAGNMNNIFSAPSRTDAQSDSHPTTTGAVPTSTSTDASTTTTGTGFNETRSSASPITDSANTVGSESRDVPVTNNLSSASPTTTSTSADQTTSNSHTGLVAGGLGAAGLAGAGAAGLAGATSRSSHSGARDESSTPLVGHTGASSTEKREIGTGSGIGFGSGSSLTGSGLGSSAVGAAAPTTTSPVHANEQSRLAEHQGLTSTSNDHTGLTSTSNDKNLTSTSTSTEHKNLTSTSTSTDHSTEPKKESLIEKAKHLIGGHSKSSDVDETHHTAASNAHPTTVIPESSAHRTAGQGHSAPALTGGVLSDYVGTDRSATGGDHGLTGSSATGAHAAPSTTGLNTTSHSDSHAHASSVPTTSSNHGLSSASSGDKDRSSGSLLEAGRVAQGQSTKAGSDLLGGLALGAPIGVVSGAGSHSATTTYASGGLPSNYASGLESSTSAREFSTGSTGLAQTGSSTFSNNNNNNGASNDRVGSTGAATTAAAAAVPAGLAGLAPSHTHESSGARKEFEGLAPSHTHQPATTGSGPLAGLAGSGSTNTHEPSEPLKALAQATSPVLGSTAGVTTSAAHIDAKTVGSAHHEPADPLKSLAAATSPVLGSTAGSTTERAHHEIETVGGQTPAQPLKNLAASTSNSLGLGSSTGVKTGNATPAGTTTESHGLAETVTAAGTSVLGALGAAATGFLQGANEVVHNATGVDLLHGDPLTVQEAKEKGIDPVTGQPIASSNATGSALPLNANRNSTSSAGAFGGLGAPLAGSASGPSPAAFAAPVSTGLVGGFGAAAPLGSASGPTPAQVGGVAPIGSSSSSPSPPSHVAAPSAAPAVAATGVPSAAVVAAPAQSAAASSGRSGNSIGSTTRVATASRPAEAKSVDVFSSNDTKAKKEPGANDIPSQEETKESNHKKVPQPMITNIGETTKDRTRATGEEAGVPISSRPDADVKGAALKEEQNKRAFPVIDGVPSRSYAKQGDTNKPLAGLPLGTTQQPLATDVAPATPTKVSAPVPVNSSMGAAPATPVRAGDNVPVAAGTPATPASRVLDRETKTQPSTPSSMTSSTAGGHGKEASTDSMRKRKSSFFTKIKSAFHKDKKDKA